MNVKSSLRGPIVPQNINRTFFIFCFVSTICPQILLLWKTFKETLKIEEYSPPWYFIDLGSSNNSKRKKNLFLKNFYVSPREKFP